MLVSKTFLLLQRPHHSLIEGAWGRKGTTQNYHANFGFARSLDTGHGVHHSTAAQMTLLHGD